MPLKEMPTSAEYLAFPLRTEHHDGLSELRIVCTKRYSPSARTLSNLEEIFGDVGVERWKDFESLGKVAYELW